MQLQPLYNSVEPAPEVKSGQRVENAHCAELSLLSASILLPFALCLSSIVCIYLKSLVIIFYIFLKYKPRGLSMSRLPTACGHSAWLQHCHNKDDINKLRVRSLVPVLKSPDFETGKVKSVVAAVILSHT